MSKRLKKVFASIMAVILLLTATPLSGISDKKLIYPFSVRASAYDENEEPKVWLGPKDSIVRGCPGHSVSFIVELKTNLSDEELSIHDMNGTLVIPFLITAYDSSLSKINSAALTDEAISAGANIIDENEEWLGDDEELLNMFFIGTVTVPSSCLSSSENLDVLNVTVDISEEWNNFAYEMPIYINCDVGEMSFLGEPIKVISENSNETYIYNDNYSPESGTQTIEFMHNGYIEDDFLYKDETKIVLYEYLNSEAESVSVPASVTEIDKYAFWHCPKLKYICYPGDNLSGYRPLNNFPTGENSTARVYFYSFNEKNGICGDNVFWNLDEAGKLTISGSGSMYSFEPLNSPFMFRNDIKSVAFEGNVNNISACAFYNCDELKKVEIPDSVTSIDDYAFADCTNLASVVIPDSVEVIGMAAFYCCINLTYIKIPDSVISIGENAFALILNVAYNGEAEGAPWGAKNINAYIEDDLIYTDTSKKELVACAISKEGLVTIPDTVTSIGKGAFEYCESLTSIIFPSSVTSIGEYAFSGCKGLTSITIPYGITNIGDFAFYGCKNLTNITIPDSIIDIGERAFLLCPELSDIYFTGTEKEWKSLGCDVPSSVTIHYICRHEFEVTNYITEPSCSNEGVANLVCKKCGEVVNAASVSKLPHNLTHVVIPASCSGVGSEFDICAICGKQFNVNIIPALEHSLIHVCNDATCEGIGEEYDICSVCGNRFNIIETPALEHDIEHIFIDSTCTENGIEYDYCSRCEQKLNETVIPAEHKTTHVSITKSCTTDGEEYDICSVCGQVLNHTVEKAQGHNYTHIVVPSSCTANGMEFDYCLVCGNQANLSVLPALHTWSDWQISVYPTTISDGKSERICEKCGAKENKTLAKTISNCVIEENKIYGLTAGMTVDSFTTNNLAVNGVTVTTTPSDGNSMGTGSKVALTYPDGETVEYEVVIFGDTNGDAWYDGTDSIIVNCLAVGMLSKAQVGESVYTAADCNHDGTIDENDVALLEQAGLALSGVDQSKSEAELMTDSVFIDYLNLIDQNPFEEEISDNTPSADELPNITAYKAEKPSFIQKIIDFIVYVLRIMRSFIPQL